jgi:hypothetical protein
MSKELTPIPVVNLGVEEHWAAWQARVDKHDRATRRRLLILFSALILSGAVLSGLWLF